MKIKSFKMTFAIALLLIAAVGCDDGNIQGSAEQQIYFEVSYANNAWGSQLKGFIIDREGQIRLYDRPAGWIAGKTGLTSDQVSENLGRTSIASTSVPAADLNTFISKSTAVSGDSYSKPVSGGADRGTTSYYAYRFDKETQVYNAVLIDQKGDIEIYNKDKSAIEISAWLSGIVDKVYK